MNLEVFRAKEISKIKWDQFQLCSTNFANKTTVQAIFIRNSSAKVQFVKI